MRTDNALRSETFRQTRLTFQTINYNNNIKDRWIYFEIIIKCIQFAGEWQFMGEGHLHMSNF